MYHFTRSMINTQTLVWKFDSDGICINNYLFFEAGGQFPPSMPSYTQGTYTCMHRPRIIVYTRERSFCCVTYFFIIERRLLKHKIQSSTTKNYKY